MFKAKLADKQVLNPKFTLMTFELVEPNLLNFDAGQYVSIQVDPQGDRRSYSICSEPSKTHAFELLIDMAPHGLGVTYLDQLQFGQEISALAPMGRFYIEENMINQPLVFVATGSGVAPFRSMILDQLQKQSKVPMTLYFGLRHEEDLFWQDEWQRLQTQFPNFVFHPVLSQPKQEWPLCRGRVTNCLAVHELDKTAHYLLCGNDQMIKDVSAQLQQSGIQLTQIHHEKFY